MEENPFQAPQTGAQVVGVLSGRREDLRAVATAQKGVILCILFQIILLFASRFAPGMWSLLPNVGLLVVGIAAVVFVIMLAIKVYGVGLGIVLGLFALFPCIGLIPLLVVNGKATSVLKSNGIHVGIFGARMADFDAKT